MEQSKNENCWKKDDSTFYSGSSCATVENKKTSSDDEKLVDEQCRIGFLNQCKLELSAEVIRWKEESLKLQKENEAATKKIEELQTLVNKLARKNHELEANLCISWEENKMLRMKTLAIGEENSVLQKELSKTKYHSYPWFDIKNNTAASTVEYYFSESSSGVTESWEEVTKKLFKQMQKEMREMQKLSRTLAERDKILECVENVAVSDSSVMTRDSESSLEIEAAEEQIDAMASEIESLKQHVKLQNEKLCFLLNLQLHDAEHRKQAKTSDTRQVTSIKTTMLSSQGEITSASSEDKTHSRPSDETFRAYFTKQLTKSGSEERKVTHVYLGGKETIPNNGNHHKDIVDTQKGINPVFVNQGHKSSSPKISENSNTQQERRVCPICEVEFPKDIPDEDFEAHVMEHLEVVSATLLDQYEIV